MSSSARTFSRTLSKHTSPATADSNASPTAPESTLNAVSSEVRAAMFWGLLSAWEIRLAGCRLLLYQHLPAQDLHLQAISEDSLQIGVASRHCGIVERTIWIQELAQVRLVFDVPICTIRPRQQHEQEVRVRQRTIHDIMYMAEALYQVLVVALPDVVVPVWLVR